MRASHRTSARAYCSACSAILLVLTVGCRRGERPIQHIETLVRTGIGVDRDQVPSEDRVEAFAKKSVAQLPRYDVRSPGPGEIGWQMRVGIQILASPSAHPDDAGTVDPSQVFREAIATVDLFPLASDPKKHERVRHRGEASLGENMPQKSSFEPLVERAIAAAVKDVETGVAIDEATDAEVLKAVGSSDRRTKARALDAVRDRKLSAGLDALLKILADDEEEPEMVMKAIGGLVAIKDQRAVGPLIDSARRRPTIYLGQIIFGVAEIGGKEAEAYLFTVASGHPDPDIKSSAERALDELQHRRELKGERP
ncbi:MAG: hypothetical protein U1E65_12825 [Myxococcota bacterium]